MEDKRKELEDVLGVKLTDAQIKQIAAGWKAFYKEPKKYKKSTVPEMVKLFLNL